MRGLAPSRVQRTGSNVARRRRTPIDRRSRRPVAHPKITSRRLSCSMTCAPSPANAVSALELCAQSVVIERAGRRHHRQPVHTAQAGQSGLVGLCERLPIITDQHHEEMIDGEPDRTTRAAGKGVEVGLLGPEALFINCTLKRSPEVSNTRGLADLSVAIMEPTGCRSRSFGGRPQIATGV